MKISPNQYVHTSEEYEVRFWYTDAESGFRTPGRLMLYASSRAAHDQIEKYFKKNYARQYPGLEVFSVVYQ